MLALKEQLKNYQFYYRPRRIYRRALMTLFNPDPYPPEFIERKIIFIHIPKTAGQAVAESLFGTSSLSHATARRFQRARPELFRASLKFTFVRHPVGRFLSAFSFLKGGGMTELDAYWSHAFLRDCPDVHQFIERLQESRFRREVMGYLHFIPQWKFVADRQGKCIVDFTGRYENLSADFEYIRSKIGIGSPLKEVNVSDRAIKKAQVLEPDERRFVTDLYKADMDFFGYEEPK